jgi:L-ascorbate metabolism protein UlaG (beta-lactamase superfamily)
LHQPIKQGRDLISEIDQTITPTPTLWWLGHAGFVMRFATITFYIDPCLSTPAGRERLVAAPMEASHVSHADLILATHGHAGHMDAATLGPMLGASRRAKVVMPKSATDPAHQAGIAYDRMTTTDSDLRIEYFKDSLYGRVYSIPSAHPKLDRTAAGAYPYLGYLIRFGRWTVYHAGDCAVYDGLADRLRPFNVSVAILPIGGRNFTVSQAADLALTIGASWLVPMHYGTFGPDGGEESSFISHMLGHRPEQPFKVFQCGERWTVPED